MRKADRERQKQEEKKRQQRIDAASRKAKEFGLKIGNLKPFVVQLSCGCCDATVYFADEKGIKTALYNAGLQCSAVIEDAAGQRVEGVDTFYGYRLETDKRRGLDYLAALINRA